MSFSGLRFVMVSLMTPLTDDKVLDLSNLKALILYPKNVTLDLSKLKAFADNKLNKAIMMEYMVEKIRKELRKGENAPFFFYNIFLAFSPFPNNKF